MCTRGSNPALLRGRSASPLAVTVHRRALTIAVVSVGAVGLAVLSAPFLLSLRPSERALADAVVLEVPELKPGTYVLVLKVSDAAGNIGSGDVVFTVPAGAP